MTLLQLVTLQFISALAPVTISGVARALGTRPPASSAMVGRLADVGLVRRLPDPHDRRRIQVTITSTAQPIVGDTDEDTAQRLSAVVHALGAQTRRSLIDLLVDTVRRVTAPVHDTGASPPTTESGPPTIRSGDDPPQRTDSPYTCG